MLRITDGKGFVIKFGNGMTVSVQFGAGNYCENYDGSFDDNCELGKKGSINAECAVIDKNGDFLQLPDWTDSVKGWMCADEIGELIAWVQKQDQPKEEEA